MNIPVFAIVPGLVALIISFLATPLAIKFAGVIGIIDDPQKSSHPKVIHTYPVPRGGGLAILAGVLISSFVFLPFDQHLKGILTGALFIVAIGILDDKYDLNPYLRLILCFIAALFPVASGIGISFVSNPFGGIIDLSQPQINFSFLGEPRSIWFVSDILAILGIGFMMNILNMGAKGVDGQLPGVSAIAALSIAVLSLRFSADITQWPVIILAMITAGAYLGFLPWNFYPQKIMPGYGGSTLAGYLLGILAILSTSKVGTLLVVLGVPLIDTGYTMIRRVFQGKSPVWGDAGHLHHRLLARGFTKRGVAMFYWSVTGILGIIAVNLNTAFKFYTMIGIAAILGGFLLWLTYRPK